MDHFVLFLFFGRGGWGQIRKKIPAHLLQKKYKSCITAQSKKIYICKLVPKNIHAEKKFSLYFSLLTN